MERCPICGTRIAAGSLAAGLCPVCLLDRVLEDDPSAADDRSLEPLAEGSTFGPFRIVRFLSRGGMAAVYQAREESLDREVALKILPPHFLHDQSFAQRFEREARLVAKLDHAHIVPIYASGIADGIPWLSMRLLAGTLGDLLTGVALPTDRTVPILRAVARALDHAHSQNVIHRDIKPSNILLDAAGNACVADFGVARLIEQGVASTVTRSIVGTPQYMAPEQALGKPLDRRCDLYGLAVVAYEMLVGTPPFTASSQLAILNQHVNDPVPMPSRKLVKRRVAKVLRRGLAKRPEDRWPSASAFVDALEAAVRDRPMWLPRTAAAVVLSAAAVGFMWVRSTPDSDSVAILTSVPVPTAFAPFPSSSQSIPGTSAPGDPAVIVEPSGPPPPPEGLTPPGVSPEPKPSSNDVEPPPAPKPPSPEPSNPQPPPPTGPTEPPQRLLDDVVTEAKIISTVNPVYPAVAKAAEIEGDVLIEAACSTDGHLTNLKVVRSANRILEAAAIDAVGKYQCQPRLRNGQPEVSTLRELVQFRLK